MHAHKRPYGAIEAGGTKFICAVGTGPDDLRHTSRIPTTTPEATLTGVVDFFRGLPAEDFPSTIGIGSFGPIDLHPNSPTYGEITSTPKPGWSHVNVVRAIREGLDMPIAFDTDVNAAALGEHQWGAAMGLDTFVYLTVGTGIGGGGLVGGRRMRGLVHPEMGHVPVGNLPGDDFPGVCPYHGNCFEGMASGPAIGGRLGIPATQAPPDHPVWELTARYIARALAGYVCVLSPQRIILGGGVMEQQQLFPFIRTHLQEFLNGYIQAPEILADIDHYVVPPALGNRAGILGALALAAEA